MSFPLQRLDDICKRPQDFRLLSQIPLDRTWHDQALNWRVNQTLEQDRIVPVVFLDMLTTGKVATQDRMILLSLVRANFSLERKLILEFEKSYVGLEDVSKSIASEAIAECIQKARFDALSLTSLQGQRFNDEIVMQYLSDHPLVIAHKAYEFRPFFDRRFSALQRAAWACSYIDVPWSDLQISSRNIDFLLQADGFFYHSPCPKQDAFALATYCALHPEVFAHIIDRSLQDRYVIEADKAPFKVKDSLKEQGYRFDGDKKVWKIEVQGKEEAIAKIEALDQLYPNAKDKAIITRYSAQDRFKEQ